MVDRVDGVDVFEVEREVPPIIPPRAGPDWSPGQFYLFSSAQCLCYNNQHGQLTKELCLPNRADHRPADGADDQVPEPGQGLGPYNSPYSDISGKVKLTRSNLVTVIIHTTHHHHPHKLFFRCFSAPCGQI